MKEAPEYLRVVTQSRESYHHWVILVLFRGGAWNCRWSEDPMVVLLILLVLGFLERYVYALGPFAKVQSMVYLPFGEESIAKLF